MEFFIFWLFFCILVGVYAHKKGRFGTGYFFLSFMLSPLIGFLIAALVDNKRVCQRGILR